MSWQSLSNFNALSDNVGTGMNVGMLNDAPMSFMGQTSPIIPDSGSFTAPQISAAGGMGSGFGFNMPTAQLALGGLQALGNLWGGIQANKMAKKQFKFAKGMARTNLANQVKSYNTALADRARGRAVMESQTDAMRDAYVKDNSLSTSHNAR